MLKISYEAAPHGTVTLHLEGRVGGPWVAELQSACEQVLASGHGLILDLAEVSFIDLEGRALCRYLQSRHVALLHGSPFVIEQLKA